MSDCNKTHFGFVRSLSQLQGKKKMSNYNYNLSINLFVVSFIVSLKMDKSKSNDEDNHIIIEEVHI